MTNFLKQYLFLLLIVVATTVGLTSGRADAAWSLGSPVVTYWDGPILDDRVAQQAINGGFNLVWAHSLAALNIAQSRGLRALYYGSLDDQTIAQVRNHPALYAYFLRDEPSASGFADLGATVSHLRTLDPNHLAYVNLLPTYATSAQLGASDYPTYLNQYMSTVQPSLLSYDNYQFYTGSDHHDYFKNLSIVSHTAKQAGIPFMNIVQGCAWWTGWRIPNANELRFLSNTTLAYGGQAISYFNYMTYNNPDSGGGIQNSDGTPTSVYTALQSINPQFLAIAQELQSLNHISTGHLGDLPPGFGTTDGSSPMRLSDNSPFQLSPGIANTNYRTGEPVRGAVLGLFGPNNQLADATCTLAVNLDYSNSLNTTVTGPGNLSVFDPATGTWIAQGHSWADVSLLPGGSVLVGLTSVVPEPSTLMLLVTGLFGLLCTVWRKGLVSKRNNGSVACINPDGSAFTPSVNTYRKAL